MNYVRICILVCMVCGKGSGDVLKFLMSLSFAKYCVGRKVASRNVYW